MILADGLRAPMRRLETIEPSEIVFQKPPTSLFSPHCIVVALLPNQYEARIEVGRGYHAIQMHTLKWLKKILKTFVDRPSTRAGGILNADNQLLLPQEVRDSVHVARDVIGVIDQTLKSPKPSCTTLHDVMVPLMCGTSFGGNEDAMIEFLAALERSADFLKQTRRHVLGELTTKSAARSHVVKFERQELGRHARSAVTQSLTRTRVSYGGAPVLAAFALALIRQAWAEMKVDLYTHVGLSSYAWR
jgi:hypothetical protein